MSQENVEIVRRTMDPFEQGELSSIFAQGLATPDAELRPAFEVPGAGTYVGLGGLTEFMRIWTEDFDRWELHIERVAGAGDEVAVLAGQSALGVGDVAGERQPISRSCTSIQPRGIEGLLR
jgi:hypothetical protein